MAASNITQHLQRVCRHHSARCPECLASVLCNNMCAHLRSGCSNLATRHPPPEHGGQTGQDVSLLTALGRALDQHTSEIRALLEQLLSIGNTRADRPTEISQGVNAVRMTIKQENFQGAREDQGTSNASVPQTTASKQELEASSISGSEAVGSLLSTKTFLQGEIKGELQRPTGQMNDYYSWFDATIDEIKRGNKEIEKALASLNRLICRTEHGRSQRDFCVKGFQLLYGRAVAHGSAPYKTEPMYLRGYRMSPAVPFAKSGHSLSLYLGLQLHKGKMDGVVRWPFKHNFRLSVVHPKELTKRQLEFKPSPLCAFTRRPTETSNEPFYHTEGSLNLYDLVRDGYVHQDQLQMTLELIL
ncbi:uncharacterized protein LOC144105256 [Amblyomma americanum]